MGHDLYTKCPFGDIAPSDVQRGASGYFQRDVYGLRPERHVALHVIGSVRPDLSLGLVAIRCKRTGSTVEPLTLSIPDAPMVHSDE